MQEKSCGVKLKWKEIEEKKIGWCFFQTAIMNEWINGKNNNQ